MIKGIKYPSPIFFGGGYFADTQVLRCYLRNIYTIKKHKHYEKTYSTYDSTMV